jgi:hypothetical protein
VLCEAMPRKLRIEYPGAMYHVMSRGDRRERIFLDDVDRQDFIKTLAEACQTTGWQVHAYCLMPMAEGIVAEELKRLGWKEADPKSRRKNDPDKLEIAARLRRETTLTIKAIAARVSLGSSKAANAKLHRHMQEGANPRKAKPRHADRRT